ncbi:hypothetical protein Y032_0308g2048 [Ancylostoma ceylanicum]|uniref:Uncharacterized protein n=1 Tax=Ancylostoma ceylanicum TaxID=53326 RepID=A0A016S3F8_9BILA|nr:hypothetical protein Y032_0308g2048 [Ancylostoma ceylanicum]
MSEQKWHTILQKLFMNTNNLAKILNYRMSRHRITFLIELYVELCRRYQMFVKLKKKNYRDNNSPAPPRTYSPD